MLSTFNHVGQNFGFRPYFQEAISGRPYVSDPSISLELGRPVLYFSAPVRASDGRVVAVAVLRLLAEEFWEIVEVRERLWGEAGAAAIVIDGYGIRIAHSTDRSLIFKAVIPLPPETERRLIAEHRLGRAERIEATDLADFARGIREAKDHPYFVHHLAINPERYHTGTALVKMKPWTVAVSVPESSFLGFIERLTRTFLIARGIVVLFVSGVGIVAAWSIVHPVRRLTDAAHRLAGGDLTIPIPAGQGDEIGRLAVSFEVMREQLRERIEELEKANQQLDESYKEIQNLMESVPDAIVVVDGGGSIVMVNGQAERIFG